MGETPDTAKEPPTDYRASSRPYQGIQLPAVSREAMACEFAIFFDPVHYPSGADVSVAALDLVTALEDQMTVYRETSEVSRLNREAGRPIG